MDVYEKLLFDMQLCGMSMVTQKNYVYHAGKFAEYCDKPIHETDLKILTDKDVTLCPCCGEGRLRTIKVIAAKGASPPVAAFK